MRRILSLALLVALVCSACGSDEAQPASDDSAQTAGSAAPDGEWVLDFLVIEGDMAIPLPAEPVDFRVDGDTFGGSAGCNSMGGSATFEPDGTLRIGDAFMTEMACADQTLMDFEQTYMSALPGATSWAVEGTTLTLRGGGAELIYVVRTAPPDLPIIDTVWTLDTFFDVDTAMTAVGMDEVTVVFSDAGVTASGACWTITGPAVIEPGGEGNLRVDLADTEPSFSCDDRAFLDDIIKRLGQINEYEVDESRLTLGRSEQPVLGLRG